MAATPAPFSTGVPTLYSQVASHRLVAKNLNHIGGNKAPTDIKPVTGLRNNLATRCEAFCGIFEGTLKGIYATVASLVTFVFSRWLKGVSTKYRYAAFEQFKSAIWCTRVTLMPSWAFSENSINGTRKIYAVKNGVLKRVTSFSGDVTLTPQFYVGRYEDTNSVKFGTKFDHATTTWRARWGVIGQCFFVKPDVVRA